MYDAPLNDSYNVNKCTENAHGNVIEMLVTDSNIHAFLYSDCVVSLAENLNYL